jgi:hypothetical protein
MPLRDWSMAHYFGRPFTREDTVRLDHWLGGAVSISLDGLIPVKLHIVPRPRPRMRRTHH